MRISDWSSDVRASDLASSIVGIFGGAIEHMVALAALMPIVAGVGGNAGTQTLAVTVRALAMNQLTDANSWRAVWREMKIALLNGGTIALIAGTATALWFAKQIGRASCRERVCQYV